MYHHFINFKYIFLQDVVVYYMGFKKGNNGVQYKHACFGSPPSYMLKEKQLYCEHIYGTGDRTCYIEPVDNQIPTLSEDDLKFCKAIFVSPAHFISNPIKIKIKISNRLE